MKLIIASIILSFAASLSVAKMAPSTRRRLQLTRVRRSLLPDINTSTIVDVMVLNMSDASSGANVTLGVCRSNIYVLIIAVLGVWWIVPSVSIQV